VYGYYSILTVVLGLCFGLWCGVVGVVVIGVCKVVCGCV